MRVLFFGRYDPTYSRNAVLMQGLRLNGVQVLECRVEPSVRFWFVRLIWRFIRMREPFDVVLVAFPGQEVMPIIRLLTRKPVLFDAFTSHYEGYVEDRRTVAPGSFRARRYALLDRVACRLGTAVLTDTQAHAAYFAARFGVAADKLHSVFLGTTLVGTPGTSPTGEFIVHFHGSNIPLQGIEVIWGALRRLWNESIRFQMIGPFSVPNELKAQVNHEDHVSFSELGLRMARAHVCLGIFGTSPKTQRVIPNKVYEALAMTQPVITSDTPAIRELLSNSAALLIPAGDADALARAILRLKGDQSLRDRVGRAGHEALMRHATPAILGQRVKDIISSLIV
jgi:glycosyltransferase involved in cell wall biosynthesis